MNHSRLSPKTIRQVMEIAAAFGEKCRDPLLLILNHVEYQNRFIEELKSDRRKDLDALCVRDARLRKQTDRIEDISGQLRDAQANYGRVLDWARGKCECCTHVRFGRICGDCSYNPSCRSGVDKWESAWDACVPDGKGQRTSQRSYSYGK